MKLQLEAKDTVVTKEGQSSALVFARVLSDDNIPLVGKKVSFWIKGGTGGRLLRYCPFEEVDEDGIISSVTDSEGRTYVYFQCDEAGYTSIGAAVGDPDERS